MATGALGAFIERQILSLGTGTGLSSPNLEQSLLVTEVARAGVAHTAGVRAGFLLAAVDSAPAAPHGSKLHRLAGQNRSYRFRDPESDAQIDLDATGIDLGLSVEPTTDALVANYQPETPEYEQLVTLWKRGAWAQLATLATLSLARTSNMERARSALARGLDARLPGFGTPALLFLGTALYELSAGKGGLEQIQRYYDSSRGSWTVNYAGIAEAYLGQALIAGGVESRGRQTLAEGWTHTEYARVADMLERAGLPRPAPTPGRWQGKRFPARYTLPRIAGSGLVKLEESLAALGRGQPLIVCSLASYRGNGPYDDFMDRYTAWAAHFGELTPRLHVITMKSERPQNRAHWFRAEDRARAQGVDFDVLQDSKGALAAALHSTGSPHLLVLNADRQVLHDGELNGLHLWNVLAELGAPRTDGRAAHLRAARAAAAAERASAAAESARARARARAAARPAPPTSRPPAPRPPPSAAPSDPVQAARQEALTRQLLGERTLETIWSSVSKERMWRLVPAFWFGALAAVYGRWAWSFLVVGRAGEHADPWINHSPKFGLLLAALAAGVCGFAGAAFRVTRPPRWVGPLAGLMTLAWLVTLVLWIRDGSWTSMLGEWTFGLFSGAYVLGSFSRMPSTPLGPINLVTLGIAALILAALVNPLRDLVWVITGWLDYAPFLEAELRRGQIIHELAAGLCYFAAARDLRNALGNRQPLSTPFGPNGTVVGALRDGLGFWVYMRRLVWMGLITAGQAGVAHMALLPWYQPPPTFLTLALIWGGVVALHIGLSWTGGKK